MLSLSSLHYQLFTFIMLSLQNMWGENMYLYKFFNFTDGLRSHLPELKEWKSYTNWMEFLLKRQKSVLYRASPKRLSYLISDLYLFHLWHTHIHLSALVAILSVWTYYVLVRDNKQSLIGGEGVWEREWLIPPPYAYAYTHCLNSHLSERSEKNCGIVVRNY